MPESQEPKKLTNADKRLIRSRLADEIQAEFAEARPTEQEFAEWINATALRHGVDPAEVKKVLKDQRCRLEFSLNAQLSFRAEKIATAAGATLAKAMRRVAEALDAKKRIVKHDRLGNCIFDETVDDWDVILRAAEDLFKIRAAYAPQEIQVQHGVTDKLAELSEADIKTRMADLVIRVKQMDREQKQLDKPN